MGGGEGVTAVVAAKTVGETGSVICFEGNSSSVRNIKTTAVRNKVSNRVAVEHAVVGKAISVYAHQMTMPPSSFRRRNCPNAIS